MILISSALVMLFNVSFEISIFFISLSFLGLCCFDALACHWIHQTLQCRINRTGEIINQRLFLLFLNLLMILVSLLAHCLSLLDSPTVHLYFLIESNCPLINQPAAYSSLPTVPAPSFLEASQLTRAHRPAAKNHQKVIHDFLFPF